MRGPGGWPRPWGISARPLPGFLTGPWGLAPPDPDGAGEWAMEAGKVVRMGTAPAEHLAICRVPHEGDLARLRPVFSLAE